MLKTLALSFLALGFASGVAIADDKLWLHVRVAGDEDHEQVSINLPIALAESMIPMINSDDFDEGHIRFNGTEFDAADIRRMWAEISKAEDGEFLTIEERDETVRVSKDKGLLRIFAKDREEDNEFELQVPIEVVNAILSSATAEEDEIDLAAGLKALRADGPPIIVRAEDQESMVRIWVDDDQAGTN